MPQEDPLYDSLHKWTVHKLLKVNKGAKYLK